MGNDRLNSFSHSHSFGRWRWRWWWGWRWLVILLMEKKMWRCVLYLFRFDDWPINIHPPSTINRILSLSILIIFMFPSPSAHTLICLNSILPLCLSLITLIVWIYPSYLYSSNYFTYPQPSPPSELNGDAMVNSMDNCMLSNSGQ